MLLCGTDERIGCEDVELAGESVAIGVKTADFFALFGFGTRGMIGTRSVDDLWFRHGIFSSKLFLASLYYGSTPYRTSRNEGLRCK